MIRTAFGAEFVGAQGFLNSPTYGLPPRFVTKALRDVIGLWEAGTMDAAAFDKPVGAARSAYAALAGVPVESVAMGSSVSVVLGLVAAAVPDGSRVAAPAGEFTSVTFPFAAQAGRGVTVTEFPPGEFERAAGEFDLAAASLVQSATGAVLDTVTLRAAVGGTRTVTVIDATQALGWCNADLSWADVTAAGGYKWLLSPRGTAWISLSSRLIDQMTPHLANWYAGDEPWSSIYGLPLRLASDARRFDTSPAWFSALGAGLSLPWLASLDRTAVHSHTVGLANRLRSELDLPAADSAIVSIPSSLTSVPAADRLRDAGIRASVRAGAVRVGFHLYNTADDLDRLLDALRD